MEAPVDNTPLHRANPGGNKLNDQQINARE